MNRLAPPMTLFRFLRKTFFKIARKCNKLQDELDESLAKHNMKIGQFEEDLHLKPANLDEPEQFEPTEESGESQDEEEQLEDEAEKSPTSPGRIVDPASVFDDETPVKKRKPKSDKRERFGDREEDTPKTL